MSEGLLAELRGVEYEVFEPIPTRILQPTDVRIPRAATVAVVGPSGAGKTTLAAILGGLVKPSAGSYHFDGESVHDLSHRGYAAFRKKNVGFVFQLANLIDERTALQNVAIGLTDHSVEKSEMQQRCYSALADVGLERIVDRQAALLSGGERQRVAIARALVKKPQLIIADEPTGALDQGTSREVLELLRGLTITGTTLVMVTHDLEAASMMQRRIEILDGEVSSV